MNSTTHIEGLLLVAIVCYVCYVYEYSIPPTLLLCYIIFFLYLLLSLYSSNQYTRYEKISSQKHKIPRHIYTYCDTDNELIKKCITSWKQFHPFYKIHIITKQNFIQYVPGLDFTNVNSESYSEMICLSVLTDRGGIWLEPHVYLHESLDWVHAYQYNEESECVGYTDSDGNIQPWLLACIPNSSFITRWRNEYLSTIHTESHIESNDLFNLFTTSQPIKEKSLSLLPINNPSFFHLTWLYPFYPLLYKEPVILLNDSKMILNELGLVDYL
jgi:hypothetical protein